VKLKIWAGKSKKAPPGGASLLFVVPRGKSRTYFPTRRNRNGSRFGFLARARLIRAALPFKSRK